MRHAPTHVISCSKTKSNLGKSQAFLLIYSVFLQQNIPYYTLSVQLE